MDEKGALFQLTSRPGDSQYDCEGCPMLKEHVNECEMKLQKESEISQETLISSSKEEGGDDAPPPSSSTSGPAN